MFGGAIAGIAYVDFIQHTAHAVVVESALGHAAGNTAVNRLFHLHSLLPLYYSRFFGFYLTNRKITVKIERKQLQKEIVT